jgi:alpha-ribazole phosphatase
MMRLLLVRHGVTLNNLEDRFTGQADVPLSALGHHQAAAVGERLSAEPLDVIVASDLQRTRATAQMIAHHYTLSVQEDANLREMALGEWEGLTYAEVVTRNAACLHRWQMDSANYAPPGGETATQVRDRVVRALGHWQEQYPTGIVLWVTHAGVIEVLLCHLLGMDLNRRHQFRLENASITELDLSRKYAILIRLNETAHLRGVTVKF